MRAGGGAEKAQLHSEELRYLCTQGGPVVWFVVASLLEEDDLGTGELSVAEARGQAAAVKGGHVHRDDFELLVGWFVLAVLLLLLLWLLLLLLQGGSAAAVAGAVLFLVVLAALLLSRLLAPSPL